MPSSGPSASPSSVPSTSAPTPTPSTSPSSSPSLSPSSAPSIYCQDSIFKFKTKTTADDNYSKKCSQIKKADKVEVCGYTGVKSHCPVTCDGCVDSSLRFEIDGDWTNCKKQENACGTTGIFHTCRSTCGICKTTVPSAMPSSVPSALPSLTPSLTPSFAPSSVP